MVEGALRQRTRDDQEVVEAEDESALWFSSRHDTDAESIV